MARKISENFIKELKSGILKPILDYVKSDDTLNIELRGDQVIVYYRGGVLLTILEKQYILKGMDKKYFQSSTPISPSLETIEDYIPKAKHFIDVYITQGKNHLGEKDIQQQIVKENNYSVNSSDTDFYIIDTEYQYPIINSKKSEFGRFDIVALRWDSTSSARKLPKSYLPSITIFEVKQGYNSSSGKQGLYGHAKDFKAFLGTVDLESFKQDMIAVFQQKRELGLVKGIEWDEEKKNKEVVEVNETIDFVFLLADYKPKSSAVKKELERFKEHKLSVEPKFIYANAMGYGLFVRNIISGDEFTARFLCK